MIYIRHLLKSQRTENKELKDEVADLRKEIHEQVNKRLEAAATEKDLSRLEAEIKELKSTVNMPLLNQQLNHLNTSVGELTTKVEAFMLAATRQEERLAANENYVRSVSMKITRHLEGDHNGQT